MWVNRNLAYPTNSWGMSESISKKNLAWSAALRYARAQIPEIEKSVIPDARATE